MRRATFIEAAIYSLALLISAVGIVIIGLVS